MTLSEYKADASLFVNLLTDYETQVGVLSSTCRRTLKTKPWPVMFRYVCDLFMCHLLLGPLVVIFWRGVWDYTVLSLDNGIFQGDCVTPNVICLPLGLMLSFGLQFFQTDIHRLAGDPDLTWFKFVSRVFSILLGVTDILYWKGLWDGINCLSKTSPIVAVGTLVVGVTVLTWAKALRSIASSPVGITLDTADNCCQTATYWDISASPTVWSKMVNVSLSIIVEGFVVLVWHGTWSLIDFGFNQYGYTYGDSGWISLAIGFFGDALMLLCQFPLMKIHLAKGREVTKWCCNLIFCLWGGFVTINSFRGVWYLTDYYYLPDQYALSLIHGFLLSTLTIMVLGIGSSLHPGIIRDLPNQHDGLLIPFFYLTHIYIEEVEAQTKRTRTASRISSIEI